MLLLGRKIQFKEPRRSGICHAFCTAVDYPTYNSFRISAACSR